ncbi:hypothetical protein [truncated ORF], partial [Aspergillus niger]|uniref:Asparagine--tRNA ligase N-terminal domain-containing protein n=2 Tax=Aspergillus niger TaxID=5061 RepID=A0AAJ8E4C4_ASPNG
SICPLYLFPFATLQERFLLAIAVPFYIFQDLPASEILHIVDDPTKHHGDAMLSRSHLHVILTLNRHCLRWISVNRLQKNQKTPLGRISQGTVKKAHSALARYEQKREKHQAEMAAQQKEREAALEEAKKYVVLVATSLPRTWRVTSGVRPVEITDIANISTWLSGREGTSK